MVDKSYREPKTKGVYNVMLLRILFVVEQNIGFSLFFLLFVFCFFFFVVIPQPSAEASYLLWSVMFSWVFAFYYQATATAEHSTVNVQTCRAAGGW